VRLAAPGPAAAQSKWRRSYLWLLPRPRALAAAGVSLAAAEIGGVSASDMATFACRLDAARLSFLWDHVVGGTPIFPAAGFLDAAASAAATLLLPTTAHDGTADDGGRLAPRHDHQQQRQQRPMLLLTAAAILAPLVLCSNGSGGGRGGDQELLISVSLDSGRIRVTSRGGAGSATSAPTTHLAADAALARAAAREPAAQPAAVRLARLLGGPPNTPSSGGYANSAASGALCAPPQSAGEAHDFSLHPALLDSALQLGAAVASATHAVGRQAAGSPGDTKVPVGLSALLVPLGDSGAPACRPAFAATRAFTGKSGQLSSSYWLVDKRGAAAGAVDGLVAKAIPKPAQRSAQGQLQDLQAARDCLYQIDWVVDSPEAALDRIQEAGSDDQRAAEAACDLSLTARADGGLSATAALVAALQAQQPRPGAGAPLSVRTSGAEATALHGASGGPAGRGVAGALVSAVLRTATQEQAAQVTAQSDASLHTCIRSGAGVSSKAVRLSAMPGAAALPAGSRSSGAAAGATLTARLRPVAAAEQLPPHQLVPRRRGAFSGLVPAAVDVTAAALAPGQIGLRVQAVGLNFRDVLNVRRGVVRIDE
jgi:hypothetical protein